MLSTRPASAGSTRPGSRSTAGSEFYNTGRIGFDLPFLASRLGFVPARPRRRGLSQRPPGRDRCAARAARPSDASGSRPRRPARRRGSPRRAPAPLSALAHDLAAARASLRGGRWRWRASTSSELAQLARASTCSCRSSSCRPSATSSTTGAFEAPLLITPGLAAARMMNTLTLLVCLLLAFYTVESLWRDRATGLGAIDRLEPGPLRRDPARQDAGQQRGRARSSCWWRSLTCFVVILVQGKVAFSLDALPARLGAACCCPPSSLWTAFVAAVFSLTRSRYATYGLALAAFIVTGYFQFRDKMNWVGNWNLWDAVRWSDMGPLELDRPALVLNRLLALGLAALFVAIAVRFFPRTEQDPALILTRLQPRPARPRAAPAAAVRAGAAPGRSARALRPGRPRPEGGGGEKEAKDYWKQNLATWKDAPLPDLARSSSTSSSSRSASSLHGQGQLRAREPRGAAAGAVPAHRRPPLRGRGLDPGRRALRAGGPHRPLRRHAARAAGARAVGDARVLLPRPFPDGVTKNGGRIARSSSCPAARC